MSVPTTSNTDKVTVVREGEGRPIMLAYSLYETKLAGPSKSGVGVFKQTSRPGKLLAPPHKHRFDEILLVTKGEVVSFTYDAEGNLTEHVLRAGDMIFLPAGTVEGFRTRDTGSMSEMYWFMLGDPECTSEIFFERVGIPVAEKDRGLPDPDEYVYWGENWAGIQHLDSEGKATGFADVPGWKSDERR